MAFLFSCNPTVKRPEETQKIIKGADFWSYRLASDIVHEAFLREKSIIHAAEVAYASEQARGYKDGLEKAQIELAEHMMAIVNRNILYLTKTESQFASLVHDAVRQIILDYDDKEKTLAVVKSAVGAMRGQKHIVLKVNPANVDFVVSELKTIHEAFPSVSQFEVLGQSGIAEDACIVHTEMGSAEASITAQLKALETSLHHVFGDAGHVAADPEPLVFSEEGGNADHLQALLVAEQEADTGH
jgi:type III secretion system HrpE/YscL family protein